MRIIPFLSKKDVVKGVKYSNTVVIRYVLPKREVVKIMAAVVVTELLLHTPVRRAWLDKVNAVPEKIDRFFEEKTSDEQA
jgi:hypothetical protein